MPATDRGVSLLEILISIMLLGTGATATLVTLRTSTHSSAIDKNLATTYEYLQNVSDHIYGADRLPCYQGLATIRAAYDAAAKTAAAPVGWTKTATVTNVEFLGRALRDDPFSWGASFCFESPVTTNPYYTSPLYTQKVTFTVTDPGGGTRTMQVVKSEK